MAYPPRRICLGTVLLLSTLALAPAVQAAEPGRASLSHPRIAEKIAEHSGPEQMPEPPQPYDEPDKAQELYRLKRVPAGEDAVPVERYFAALEQMRTMRQYSTRNGAFVPSRAELDKSGLSYAAEAEKLGTWNALGPGNVGGRTRTLVFHPRNANILYAGGVAGGVWKSTDGGLSWRALDDLMANLAINSLALDPSNPEVLYAGTGEGFFSGDAVRGAGIFKSTDGGEHWQRLAATDNPDFYYVNDIVISPHSGSRLYAATFTGVWRSLDAGQSWDLVVDTDSFTGCLDLAIRTDQPGDFVLASCGNFDQGTVYRKTRAETDGSWSVVLSDPGMGRTTLAFAPSNQSIVYALAASTVPGRTSELGEEYVYGLHAVFRSARGGDPGSWKAQVRNNSSKKLNRVLLSNPLLAFARECGLANRAIFLNQGWYDNAIAVDPKDPNRVWAGGIDLLRSDDGGKNWGLASYWWASDGVGFDSASSYSHADQHLIVFPPTYNGGSNKTMYVAGDGGIFRTRNARAATVKTTAGVCNAGAGKTAWTPLNNNYGVTQFYHGLPLPGGAAYFGGTQDNGTVVGNDGAGHNGWREVLGGDGGFVAFDPGNPNVLYAENTGLSIAKSVNGGAAWRRMILGIIDTDSLFIAPFVMDPRNSQRLWTGGTFLWRTDNGAERWTQASAKLSNTVVSALAVSPLSSDRVLAGTASGAIYRTASGTTTDGGTVWTSTQPRQGFVSSFGFDPRSENTAYATYSSFGGTHVWRTTDGGATWSALDGSGSGRLPDIPAHSIVVDPNNSSRLYLGTDLGVFVSTDGGTTWAVENTGFANVVTVGLAVQGGDLFAFTHGRGAWRVPLS
ncbi:MAG TPA: hypothetical protein VMW27_16975 [Thermoanaerobaculia bacterium]|nr:hypothetical protein [Thermoanaerobaculia bacterium]